MDNNNFETSSNTSSNPQQTNNNIAKKTPFWKGMIIVYIVIGMFLVMGVAIFIMGYTSKNKYYTAKAVIVDIIEEVDYDIDGDEDYHYYVYVDYTVNDVEYKNVQLSYYSSSMYIGQEIEIYYERSNPGNPQNPPSTLMIIGGIFVAVSIAGGIILTLSNRLHKY
ncbi:MAG: DUF3592 domain-containing protein [Clostridia bacterium]|nr:DUF3592 domain-containing protein [Clostridia bacterium]